MESFTECLSPGAAPNTAAARGPHLRHGSRRGRGEHNAQGTPHSCLSKPPRRYLLGDAGTCGWGRGGVAAAEGTHHVRWGTDCTRGPRWRSSASLICRFSRTASEPSLSRQVTRLRACARAAVRARARGLRTWCKLTCRWGSVRYRNSKAEVMPTSMRVEGSVTCPHLCKWAGLCLEYCLGDL